MHTRSFSYWRNTLLSVMQYGPPGGQIDDPQCAEVWVRRALRMAKGSSSMVVAAGVGLTRMMLVRRIVIS